MGENHFSSVPVAVYGFVLFMASVAWYVLAFFVIQEEGKTSKVGVAYQKDMKTKMSMVVYAAATGIALFQPWISLVIYAFLAAFWFIPDKRIEGMM